MELMELQTGSARSFYGGNRAVGRSVSLGFSEPASPPGSASPT